MSTPNQRQGAIDEILRGTVNITKNLNPLGSIPRAASSSSWLGSAPSMPSLSIPSYSSAYSTASSYTSSTFTPETGDYFMKVFYFLFFYIFILLIVLVFVHYTVRPIFKFKARDKGYIMVPSFSSKAGVTFGESDSLVYWNKKIQPIWASMAPIKGDTLSAYQFFTNFSFCIDLYIRKISDTQSTTRLILYKTNVLTTPLAGPTPDKGVITLDNFTHYMSQNTSMIMYLTQTNDLMVTFFSGQAATSYSIPYIKNVPLYTPFRITVIAEDKMFSVYMNGKQVFQRLISEKLTVNSSAAGLSSNNAFYSPPSWANTPSQTVFVQNFQLWSRAISYIELTTAQPALALVADFGASSETSSGTCLS